MTWSKVTNAASVPQVGDHCVYGDYDGPAREAQVGGYMGSTYSLQLPIHLGPIIRVAFQSCSYSSGKKKMTARPWFGTGIRLGPSDATGNAALGQAGELVLVKLMHAQIR
jgi:hypothetical protein